MTTLRRLLIVLAFLTSVACSGNPIAPDSDSLPAWLTTLIRQSEEQPVVNPPAFIARYEYKGQIVYFLPQRCCDVMSDVYREDGSVLCHPDGGFTGAGDGNCADFFRERRNEQIIWRDTRGAP